jgi:LAO/AO transport system kinase
MSEWARKIREGDARALARVATGIENGEAWAAEALRELGPLTSRARTIGITGPPGAGKSTLVDALARFLRQQGKTVAIVAVDPTSRISGGAILGDRIRMERHHADSGVFIRSMATRGARGGLAGATADVVRLMDAAGKDYILIETAGVGQDEIEIAALAQVTVVVLVPGMGDDVQAAKAGILEIAGVFAINKSDYPGADKLERDLANWFSLGTSQSVPIVKTIATENKGIAELVEAVEAVAVARASERPAKWRCNGMPRLDHVGIAVKSIDDALRLFEGQLGMQVASREEVAQEMVEVAMLPAGDSKLELLEPSAPESTVSRFLEKRGPGLHHVALRVPDLKATVERLRSAGARLVNEPRRGADGRLYVFVHPASAAGVLLELIEESGS